MISSHGTFVLLVYNQSAKKSSPQGNFFLCGEYCMQLDYIVQVTSQ